MKIAGIFLAACLVILLPSTTAAKKWFTVGLGGGSSGFAIGASYSFTTGPLLSSVRGLSSYSSGWIGLDKEEQDIGVLIGLFNLNAGGELLAASIGIGYVDGVECETLPELTILGSPREVTDPFTGPAALLQVEAYSTARIGLLGYGNFNEHESF